MKSRKTDRVRNRTTKPIPTTAFIVIYVDGGLPKNVFLRSSARKALAKARAMFKAFTSPDEEAYIERVKIDSDSDSRRIASFYHERREG